MEPIVNYVLLDRARILGNFDQVAHLNDQVTSLYKEKGQKILTSVGPYLCKYSTGSVFAEWLMKNGWGNSWCIYLNATVGVENLLHHFRKNLFAKIEGDKKVYFRYYDPRVLKMFLPSCDRVQVKDFFGPVKDYFLEGDAENEVVHFWHQEGHLRRSNLSISEFMALD